MVDHVGVLRKIFSVDDGECERLLRAAVDCYVRKDFDRTEAILSGLIAVSDDPRPLKLLGSTLFLDDRHDEAMLVYERALELDPDDPYVLVALGELKLRNMLFDEAIPIFERLFALDPERDHPAANRGRHLIKVQTAALQAAGHR